VLWKHPATAPPQRLLSSIYTLQGGLLQGTVEKKGVCVWCATSSSCCCWLQCRVLVEFKWTACCFAASLGVFFWWGNRISERVILEFWGQLKITPKDRMKDGRLLRTTKNNTHTQHTHTHKNNNNNKTTHRILSYKGRTVDRNERSRLSRTKSINLSQLHSTLVLSERTTDWLLSSVAYTDRPKSSILYPFSIKTKAINRSMYSNDCRRTKDFQERTTNILANERNEL
jgi:hypothetical protein